MKIKLQDLRSLIREAIEEAAPLFGDEFEPEHDDSRGIGKLHPQEKEEVDNHNRYQAAFIKSKLTPQDSKPYPKDDEFDWDSDGPSPDYPDYSDVDADDENFLPPPENSRKLTAFVKNANQLAKQDGFSFDDIKEAMQANKEEIQRLVLADKAQQAEALLMHHLFVKEDEGYKKNGYPKSWKL